MNVLKIAIAASQAKRHEFFIVGVDGAPEAIDRIASKNSLYAATATQNPMMIDRLRRRSRL